MEKQVKVGPPRKRQTSDGVAWRIRWREPQDDGTEKRRSQQLPPWIKTREEAEEYRRDFEQKLNKLRAEATVGEAFEEYLASQRTHWRPRTYTDAKSVLGMFKKFVGSRKSIRAVTGRDVQRYFSKRAREVSPRTHDKDLRRVRSAFRSLAKKPLSLIDPDENPIDGIKEIREEPEISPPITRKEGGKIVHAAYKESTFWGMCIHAVWETAFRRSELGAVTWNDVSFEIIEDSVNCIIRVVPRGKHRRKNKGSVSAPVSRELGKVLMRYQKHLAKSGLDEGYVFRPWLWSEKQKKYYQWGHDFWGRKFTAQAKVAYRDAGVEMGKKPLHDLRAAAATDAIESGVDFELTRRGFGWRSDSVLRQHYFRTRQEQAAAHIRDKRNASAGITIPENGFRTIGKAG